MRTRPTVTEVARNFAAYLDRVAFRGERFVLTRAGRPVAELAPVPIGGRLGDLPDMLASLPSLGDAAAELAADLDRAREELGVSGVRDPWAS
jgi:antitoxin (DNA-binding transcriptional repressor) of toxin-antitoxin stability system